ncbi:WXG100 family type VII secretion target [Lentzea jiangxiensis]|uniref:PPE family protein n=1 Tax=Lentzea jiangxiensis TaxID=641025 RepID=A0A1H0QUR9_9PSEU|nr:PPE domain-containing protein [Lentzea jiangxiensis]SDP21051.1 PPE family protein [Lentzea jiangxiensis]
MSNPLIAKKEDDNKRLAGAGMFDTAEDLVKPFAEGKEVDGVALGIDGAALALDVAGYLTDPLGTLASSVVGWIIENVGFIREPFDKLMGDPPAIEAIGTTWENISKRLSDEANAYESHAKTLDDWTGNAADAYRTRCASLVAHLRGSSAAASSAANKIKVAGAVVAATRALIRDLLADLAGTLLVWGIPAAASAIPTAGASIAAFITRAVMKAVEIGTKIARFVAKLFGALEKLGSLAKTAGAAMRKQADDLAALSRQMPNSRYGNQRAAELASDSATKVSRADTLDNVGDGLGNAGRRVQDGVDNVMNKVDDFAQRTSQKVDDWAARVKENGPARKQTVKDFYERMNQPPLNTRKENMGGPQAPVGRAADRVDAPLSKGLLDGQNWVRAVSSRDISHLVPNWGDLVHPVKELSKELNKAEGGGHKPAEEGRK